MIKNLIRKSILGIKTYEPGKPIEEIKRSLKIKAWEIPKYLPLLNMTKLASNENPSEPSGKVIEAMKKAATTINRYPDPFCYYLKKALSEELSVQPENLVIGNGSNEIIQFILRAFLNEGEEVIISEPSFLIYEIATKVVNGTPVTVPLKNFKHDLEAIRGAITEKTKLIFIDNPNNPTGRSVGEAEVEGFFEKLPANVVVVFDEAYSEFVEREDYPDTKRYIGRKNIIILRTFSKAYGLSGLRVGYAIAEKEIIGFMDRTREPFNVNAMAQAAAVASLKDKEHMERSKVLVSEGKQYLYEELDSMGLDYVKSDANFILINLKRNGKEIFKKMLGEGVIVRDMEIYKLYNYIRVTVGTMPENKKFAKALKRVLSGKGSGIEINI